MRNLNANVLSGSDNQTVNGNAVDSNQLVSASFQAYFGDAQATGTFKLQASNDICNDRYQAGIGQTAFAPTHWTDIPSQTTNVTSGASALLTVANMAYRWVRAVWTPTAAGVQTIGVVADVAGSLNNKYFLLQDANNAHLYYVWINVDSTGVDPMIAGRTGVPIAIAAGDSAAAIGALITTAIAALNSTNSFTASGTSTVTVTNKVAGPFVPMTDGAAHTGFTFSVTSGGNSSVNVQINALSM